MASCQSAKGLKPNLMIGVETIVKSMMGDVDMVASSPRNGARTISLLLALNLRGCEGKVDMVTWRVMLARHRGRAQR